MFNAVSGVAYNLNVNMGRLNTTGNILLGTNITFRRMTEAN